MTVYPEKHPYSAVLSDHSSRKQQAKPGYLLTLIFRSYFFKYQRRINGVCRFLPSRRRWIIESMFNLSVSAIFLLFVRACGVKTLVFRVVPYISNDKENETDAIH